MHHAVGAYRMIGMMLAFLGELLSALLFLTSPSGRVMAYTIGAIWAVVLVAIARGLWHVISA
ncbi:MAG: hypothetical protein ACREMB_09245 [Candidatus Rokuibacteriota bacterium]